MIPRDYLEDAIRQLHKLKDLADPAISRLSAEHLFGTLALESNSIAIIMKHLAGNMRSRWTDFLTADGEKPDRDRDGEFVESDTTRAGMMQRWEGGWDLLFATLDGLKESDLLRTVRIRGEALTVIQAIVRQLTHYAQHVGQIAYIGKHLKGERWKSLSIPKGKSAEFFRRG